MAKIKIVGVVVCLLLVVTVLSAFSVSNYDTPEDDYIIDISDKKNMEDCELNEMSTKDCLTYSADHCIKGSWFVE